MKYILIIQSLLLNHSHSFIIQLLAIIKLIFFQINSLIQLILTDWLHDIKFVADDTFAMSKALFVIYIL